MAVVSVSPRSVHEAQCTDTPDGRQYTVNYLVTTDSQLDGPQVVVDATDLPDFGDPYALGNDSDASAFLLQKTPRIAGEGEGSNQTLWLVECLYGQSDRGDASGAPTNSPLDEEPQIEIGVQQTTEIVAVAQYRGKFGELAGESQDLGPADDPLVKQFGISVPMSSSAERHEPPLERPIGYPSFRVTRNEQNIATRLQWLNAVNVDQFILGLGNANLPIRPFELYMVAITGQYRRAIVRSNVTAVGESVVATRINRQILSYWRVTYELLYRPNFALPERSGWLEVLVDRGTVQQMRAGDSDNSGGTVSSSALAPAGRAAIAPVERIKGLAGDDVSKPVNLDGAGKVLGTIGNPPQLRGPVATIWLTRDAMPFAPLGL